MSKRLAAAACLMVLLALPVGRVDAAGDAASFITNLGRQVLDIFDDPRLSPADRETRLYAIAVKSFDVPAIAKWVLGRYWGQATATEREQFTKVFEHYMVQVYASRFSQYKNVEFRVLRERTVSEDRTIVRSEIIRPREQQPVQVDWLVSRQGNVFKIIDVTIEGVSQQLTLREEFSAVIQRNGGRLSALIERLREKTGE